VIQVMFIDPEGAPTARIALAPHALAAGVLCLIPALALAVFPGWVFGLF